METSNVAAGGTPWHRFGPFINAAGGVLGMERHQPDGDSWHSNALAPCCAAARSFALPMVLMWGGDPKPQVQEIA